MTKPNARLLHPGDALTPRQAVESVLAGLTARTIAGVVNHSLECRITINQAVPRGDKGHVWSIALCGEVQDPRKVPAKAARGAKESKAKAWCYSLTVVPDAMPAPGELPAPRLPPALEAVVKAANRGEPVLRPFRDPPQYLDVYTLQTSSGARDLLRDVAALSGVVRVQFGHSAAEVAPVGEDEKAGSPAIPVRPSVAGAASARRKIRLLD